MKSKWMAVLTLFACLAVPAHAAEFRGLIEPHRVIKIGSPSEGVLETVEVERGDVVRKGQVLATLQSGVEKANMDLARVRAEMVAPIKEKQASKEMYEAKKLRVEQLYRKQLASPNEMEEAATNSRVSDMQLIEAQENKRLAELEYKRTTEVVQRLTIRSPVDGVVVERFLSPGEYIKDQPVLKVAQIDPLNVEVVMPAAQFRSLRVGMQATVIPEAPVNGKFTAVVKVIDRVVDAASGTFGVRLEMPNPSRRLPAGLKCRVIFPGK